MRFRFSRHAELWARIAVPFIALLCVILAAPQAFAASGPARGKPLATRSLPTSVVSSVTCSGDGCSGLDPYATGCARSFYPVLAKNDTSGILRVELEYSPLCHTNWTQAYWLDHVRRPLGANFERLAGPDGPYRFFSYWTNGGVYWWINTDQVFAPHNKADACAYAALIGTGPYPGVCVYQ